MFIGHFGVGFAAKKLAPKLPLWMLFASAQFLDLLWPFLLMVGLEKVAITPGITKLVPMDFISYPFTHSLVMVLGWGLLLGSFAYLYKKRLMHAVVIFLCVISHWFLDLLVHRPDLPILFGNIETVKVFGLGLWNHPWIETTLEFSIFFGGLYLYTLASFPKSKFGAYGLVILVSLFVVIQIGNIFGPPPPNVASIAWIGHLQWLFVILAYYVDKNRFTDAI